MSLADAASINPSQESTAKSAIKGEGGPVSATAVTFNVREVTETLAKTEINFEPMAVPFRSVTDEPFARIAETENARTSCPKFISSDTRTRSMTVADGSGRERTEVLPCVRATGVPSKP